jgi:hypothetical protein
MYYIYTYKIYYIIDTIINSKDLEGIMIVCKGKCDNHPTRKVPVGGRLKEGQEPRYRYSTTKPFSEYNNQKFCGVCAQNRSEKDTRCFCCGAVLRVKPRYNRSRLRYKEISIKSSSIDS